MQTTSEKPKRYPRGHPMYVRQVRRVKSSYPGTRFCQKTKLWRAKIKVNGVNFVLGYYEFERDAAKAYQAAKDLVRMVTSDN